MRGTGHTATLGQVEERALAAVSMLLGALPVGSAQHRIVRPIYYRRLQRLGPTMRRARLRSGGRFDLDLSDYTQAQAFLTRRYDPALIRFISSRLKPGSQFVDVGAHLGFVSLAVAHACSHARVLALEPHPENYARLRMHVEINGCANVAIERLGLGAAGGRAVMSSEGEGTDYHRVLPAGRSDPGAAALEVELMALDDLAAERGIERVEVLKLDVEGHEPAVLDGASRLLAEGRIGAIVCELNDELLAAHGSGSSAIERTLAGHGFTRREIPPVGLHRLHRPSVAYENFAFLREG